MIGPASEDLARVLQRTIEEAYERARLAMLKLRPLIVQMIASLPIDLEDEVAPDRYTRHKPDFMPRYVQPPTPTRRMVRNTRDVRPRIHRAKRERWRS